jgi:hypothetical protein
MSLTDLKEDAWGDMVLNARRTSALRNVDARLEAQRAAPVAVKFANSGAVVESRVLGRGKLIPSPQARIMSQDME